MSSFESATAMPKAQNSPSAIGLLGGTFDPVHNGHLHYGQQIAEHLGLAEIQLLPAKIPPHKNATHSDSEHRKAMLSLVCRDNPLFSLNEIELNKDQTSFTISTLKAIKQMHSGPVYFFIGMDSLCQLNTWYQWQALLDYCHLVVTDRPGYQLPSGSSELGKWLAPKLVKDKEALKSQQNGLVYCAATDNLEISSTDIRKRLAQGKNCQYLLPAAILDYIKTHRLYR